MKRSNKTICLLIGVLGVPMWTAPLAVAGPGGTCVVTNTLDAASSLPPVAGSLRDCLTEVVAGGTVDFDAFVFSVANSDADTTINVLDPLPELDDGSITIEASDRRVTINGSGASSASGLVITSSGNTVRGLSIIGFTQSGVRITGGIDNVVGGNRKLGGGPNGQGLRLAANGAFGIEISGVATSSNIVKGCWIGLDASGLSAQANLAGVAVQGGSDTNTIGGTVDGEANVIGGNTFEGVTFSGTGTDDNVLIGNVIGEGPIDDPVTGRPALGNGSAGVLLSLGTQGSQVGGDDTGESNNIANNGSNGVEVRAVNSRRNSARSNRISRNVRGGIALFDGSNDAIRPPTITSIQDLGPSSGGTGSSLRLVGTAPFDGSMQVFSDSGAQGETLLGGKVLVAGGWTTDLDVSEVRNVTATLTDALGNTSRFGVFGLTSVDTDDDGVSDVLEGQAGTDPDDLLDTPDLATAALTLSKLSIKLNFAAVSKDSLKIMTGVSLSPAFAVDGATVGVMVAGHSEQFTLDAKGKASSTYGKVMVKTSAKNGPFLKYSTKLTTLTTSFTSAGLTNTTTPEGDERWVLPVAVTIGDAVQFATVTVIYKAKAGKSGKAYLPK